MNERPVSIAVVGASFAEPGSPLVATLSALLRDAHGRPVDAVGLGLRGRALGGWLSGLEADRAALDALRAADLVLVLELGGNGVAGPEQIAAAHARLRALAAAPVLWAEPPEWPIPNATARRRSAARAALVDSGADRVRHGYVPSVSEVAGDGAHLTREGYRRFAASLAPFVSRRLRRTGSIPPVAVGLLFAALAAGLAWKGLPWS